MIRNIKALGLAMAAFLALGAVYASAASAQQGFLTSDGPVTLTGTTTHAPIGENRLTTTGRFVECPESTYTGHKVATTPHELVPSGATEVTLTPHYKQEEDNCVGSSGSSSTIHMNGCDYVVKLGETTPAESAGTYGVTFDVVCPPEKEITVTTWYSQGDHTSGVTERCILHVPPQTGLAGAHATDEGNGHIKLAGTVEGITINKTRVNDPLFACLTGHDTNAKFDLNVTVAGHNEAKQPTNISLSH